MNFYVLLNLAVIVPPLAMSFDKKVAFLRHWKKVGVSILTVSTVYVIWDIIVTGRGHWHFSQRYAGNAILGGLPAGEILFFITVPYATLFIYEVVRAYFRPRTVISRRTAQIISLILTVAFGGLAFGFRSCEYTLLAFASVALLFLVILIFDPEVLTTSHTLLFFALSYAAFLAVNTVLTALPVVSYGKAFNTGIRVITIPLEDFFYNFGLLGFYLLVYRNIGKRRTRG